jgi:hypothetical protein
MWISHLSIALALSAQHEFCTDPQRNPENRRAKYLESVASRGRALTHATERTLKPMGAQAVA